MLRGYAERPAMAVVQRGKAAWGGCGTVRAEALVDVAVRRFNTSWQWWRTGEDSNHYQEEIYISSKCWCLIH